MSVELYESIRRDSYTSFLCQIVSGFPIDADRMDYFLRDSYSTERTHLEKLSDELCEFF